MPRSSIGIRSILERDALLTHRTIVWLPHGKVAPGQAFNRYRTLGEMVDGGGAQDQERPDDGHRGPRIFQGSNRCACRRTRADDVIDDRHAPAARVTVQWPR